MENNREQDREPEERASEVTPGEDAVHGETDWAVDVLLPEDNAEAAPAEESKWIKKRLAIGGLVAVATVIVMSLVIPHESKFTKVASKCTSLAGVLTGGTEKDDYFTIDTYPEFYFDSLDPAGKVLLRPRMESGALEAIQYANKELGFNGSLYYRMLETNAFMGRQREENDKYRVSWTYQPDEGLEVTYEIK